MVAQACIVNVPSDCPFSLANIPFGVFENQAGEKRPCSAIGGYVIDLLELTKLGAFKNTSLEASAINVFSKPSLNEFMKLGRSCWRAARKSIQQSLMTDGILSDENIRGKVLISMESVKMVMPAEIGDYTDFYSSKEHATNVGTMFRGKDNALQPNYLHLPVGYHGRASSVVVSGTPIHRPSGQIKPADGPPVFSATKKLDFELEMAFVVGVGNELGERIPIEEADEHIFGAVLMNDWSARDVQAWEYVPLGPFLGKNFGTVISPWIVTLDALEPLLVDGPIQEPKPLPYLVDPTKGSYDIDLEVKIKTSEDDNKGGSIVCRSNLKYLYWSFRQQLAHHSISGCNMKTGDLCGTGTISGPTKESFGSMLELSWNGQQQVSLSNGKSRLFIEDGDTVTMAGYGRYPDGTLIGFGNCTSQVLPAKKFF